MSKTTLLTFLILLPAFALVAQDSDEVRPRKPLPTEELEEYDNPPAPLPLWNAGVSARGDSTYGAFTSHQVNVNAQGQNITGDAANEPSITVDPTNHNRMSAGWRQFNSVASNFRQGGYGFTNDGGATWTFPGILENNVFRSDPVLIADDMGRFFYLSLLQSFFDNVWRSLDGGQTYTNLGPATGGDKQWFAVDNTNSSGHGFQYQCWSTAGNNFNGRQFSRSVDGGVTWMDPINIPNSPQWGTPDVDSNGTLFIGGVNVGTNQVWCIRSSNARNGAITPTFDQSTPVNIGGDFGINEAINPGGLLGQLFLACDRSGTATNNNVYMLASVLPTGAANGGDVMFVSSTNSGQTFSAPKRINDDPINPNKWHWQSTFGVAPNGRIDAVWLDTRNATNNTDSQLFYSYSFDGGVTWAPNVAVSAPFNPFLGYPNQNKMGDYNGIVSDNTGGDVAYCATFNGEEDIYYVRVSPTAPTPTPGPTASPSPTSTPPPPPTPSPTPSPSPTVGPSPTPSPSPTASTTPTASPTASPTGSPTPTPASQAINLSTRVLVQTGDNVGIGGFIVTGTAPKHVLLRAIGPSLTTVSDPLADPILELHGSGSFVTITNDNWRDNQEAEIIVDGLPPSNDLEAAIDATLPPGAYTAIMKGKANGAGVGLVEIYDLNPTLDSKLGNISTRAFDSTGSDIIIAGFILGNGGSNDTVALRGIGPSLSAAGVSGVLADPTLELRDSNGALLASNNNWQDDPTSAAALIAAGLAPSDSLESGIVMTLSPAAYTALLSGTNSGTGVGLVEVYDRGSP